MGKMKDMVLEMCEQPLTDLCAECHGDGVLEVDVPRPQGFGRDVGYLDSETVECENCEGEGRVTRMCECGSEITKAYIDNDDSAVINYPNQIYCGECINENV